MLFDPRGNRIGPSGRRTAPSVPQPTYDEVASARGTDITGDYLDGLRQHQDEILRQTGKGIGEYRRLLSDSQVHATFQQRRLAVVQNDWIVEPGAEDRESQMAAAFMEDVLEHVKWDAVTDKMLFGVFYGYAIAELLHATDGQYVYPDEIRVRDRSRFRFGDDMRPRLITRSQPRGIDLPDRKFWWFSVGSDHDDEPYGLGLAHYLYWPVRFKREDIRFYLTFLDKYAHPTPIGRFAPGTPVSERNKLLEALAAMTTDSAIILPQGMEVDSFEASRGTGSNNAYQAFHDLMDRAISKVNLGQTMTTDSASTGLGSTQGEVHMEVRQDVIQSDSKLIDESFTRHPVRWYTEWNFPGAVPPTVRRDLDEPEDQKAASERDKNVFAFGWQPTQQHMDETYGEGRYVPKQAPAPAPGMEEDVEDDVEEEQAGAEDFARTSAEATSAFATAEERTQMPSADAYTDRLQAAGLPDTFMQPVRDLLDEADSLEDFRERLFDLYGQMDAALIGEALGQALLAAELAGRYEAAENEGL